MKYTHEQWADGKCTTADYRQQFNPPTLEIGKIYGQNVGDWQEEHWLILHIVENVALAKQVWSKIGENNSDFQLFNVADGWRYKDSREAYRLQYITD